MWIVRHEEGKHLAVWAVLSLGEQICGHVCGGGGCGCDDQHLGGPGRHVHGNHGLAVLQHHLGGRHELVAGAQDFMHLQ